MLRRMLVIVFVLVLSSVLVYGQQLQPGFEAGGSEKAPTARTSSDKSGDASGNGYEAISSSTYAFSVQSGVPLEDISAGSTQLIGGGSDNDNSPAASIGFLFRLDGINYTNFAVNTNGLARLGDVLTSGNSLNALNSAANAPKLAPYWDNLCTANSGKVHYKTVGASGSRKLVVEWLNMRITRGGSGCDGTGSGTFQMWLFEGTGVVQFVYGGGMDAASVFDGGYSIGVQAGAATNFASVTANTNSVDFGTANNTQMTAIQAGTSYLFLPPVPAAASAGSVTLIHQTSLQLNWTDNAGGEEGYAVLRSTDNVNFSLVADLPPNSSGFNNTGLLPVTQYYYRISAEGSGAFSPALELTATTNTPGNIAATAAGGQWSSPSTWSGGLVPDGGDNVVIPTGTTVIIDTDALAGSLTIGDSGSRTECKEFSEEGGAPAILRFGETAAFSLTIAGNVTIGANGSFTTGGGNANQHLLRVGGDLINNGVLDLSTNNNMAGAGLEFTGASNNTWGGTGPVNDIQYLYISKGSTNANTLEMTVSNFTVQGSTTETPASGFLFLGHGTLKISGTFFGSHRTFNSPGYQIGGAAGLWLNNPNYTILPQAGEVGLIGKLRVSAGTYKVGVGMNDGLRILPNSVLQLEGGNLEISGGLSPFSPEPFTYNQSGGTLKTCVADHGSNPAVCFSLGNVGAAATSVSMSGGEIVLQNGSAQGDFNPEYIVFPTLPIANLTGTTVRFGDSGTLSNAHFFDAVGPMPNVSVYPGQNVKLNTTGSTTLRSINIGPGAVVTGGFLAMGPSIVNNGVIQGDGMVIDDGAGTTDITYSGVGTTTGNMTNFRVRGRTLTFDPSVGNLKTVNIKVTNATIYNAERITLGLNDNQTSNVEVYDGAKFASPMDFNIGSGGEKVTYNGTNTTGPEIKPDRILAGLMYTGPGSLTIAGGDLTINTLDWFSAGIIYTGNNVLTYLGGGIGSPTGYIDGNFRMRITSSGGYTFPVGQNGSSRVLASVSAVGTNPSYLTVRAIDATLPGLLPATSASRYWHITEEGDVTSKLTFTYRQEDVRGDPDTYKAWMSNGASPVVIPGSFNSGFSVFTPTGITEFTGDWGIGSQLDPGPVSISGRVLTSNGAGIRNAIVTISGGNLPQTLTFQTGQFGIYQFSGLQAGETYTVHVAAKRYRFTATSQQATPMGNLADVDFVANPQDDF